MLLILDLVPGLSVGPFTLGMPLSKAVKYVRDKKSEYRCIEVKYADQVLLEHDLILNFPEHGMHLRFEPSSQRLRLIEIYDVSRMQLRFGRGVLGGASHAATALLVYELMGPTYPGKFDAETRMYHLHYSGLLFLFPIPSQHMQHCLSHATELHLEFPDNTTPVASRICIYAGTAATPQEVAEARAPPLPKGSFLHQSVTAINGKGLSFTVGAQQISFGDSPQDVCSELGSPSSTIQKPAEPVSRHKPQRRASALDYFYSYADRGIDILFDGTSHRIKKFVLRTNAPGHTEFNSYSKCNFQLDLEPSANGSLSATRPADIRSPIHSESSDLEPFQHKGSLEAEDAEMCDHGPSEPYDREAPCESHALTPESRDAIGVSPTPSLQCAMQDMLKDMFTLPSTPSQDPRPHEQKGESSEGAAWEWGNAADWSKSILDMSARPFGLVGAPEEGSEDRVQLHSSLEGTSAQQQDTKANTIRPDINHKTNLHQGDNVNEKPGATRPEVATLPDQRDGWDDEDSVMLGLDVAVGLDLPAQSLQEDPSPPTQQAISTKVGSQSSCEDQAAVPSSESHTSSKFDAEQDASGQTGKQDQDPMQSGGQRRICISADSHFQDIEAVMGDAGIATIHTRGLGSNPFARTHVHGYKGVAFEVMRNGYMASMTLFKV